MWKCNNLVKILPGRILVSSFADEHPPFKRIFLFNIWTLHFRFYCSVSSELSNVDSPISIGGVPSNATHFLEPTGTLLIYFHSKSIWFLHLKPMFLQKFIVLKVFAFSLKSPWTKAELSIPSLFSIFLSILVYS